MKFPNILDPLLLAWQMKTEQWTKRAPKGAKRSSKWPAVRRVFLQANPTCACCGGTKSLRVHHIEPFHVNPEKELDPENLITLCEAGKYGVNCHLFVGHCGNWRAWNPTAALGAAVWRIKLNRAKQRNG